MIETVELCQFFNCLPDELYRQDANLMEEVKVYIEVKKKREDLEKRKSSGSNR